MPDWQIAINAWEALLLTIGFVRHVVPTKPLVKPAASTLECRTLDPATLLEIPCDQREDDGTK